MSLKPIKRSRRRANRRPRFETSGNWNWNPKPVNVLPILFQHPKILVLIGLIVTGFLFPTLTGYASTPVPNTAPLQCQGELRAVGAPCQDPTTLIWQRNVAAPSDLTDFNLGPGTIVYLTNCGFAAGTDCISLNPFGGSTAVAITNRPIGDLSTAVGKTLGVIGGYKMVGSGFSTGQARHWGFYITTNNTAPQHDIGSSAVYNPLNDPSVLMVVEVWCVSGTCGSAGQTATYNTFAWINKLPGTGRTINQQEDSSQTCASGGSCFVNIVANNGPTGCFAPCNADPDSANVLGLYLNFTGQVNTSGCSVGSTTFNGPGCSWIFNFAAAQTPLGTGETGTQVIAQNPFTGGGPYYEGFFSTVSGFPIQFFFAPGPAVAVGGNTGMDGFDYVPSPTSTINPANLDSGGFFGSIWNHMVNGYSQLCNAMGITGFCAGVYSSASSAGASLETAVVTGLLAAGGAITSALSFLEGIMVSVLNTVGNAFGLGNVGTDLSNLINALITFFANGQFANIFTNLPTIFSRLIDTLSVYFPWLPSAITIGLNVSSFLINGVGFALTVLADATLIGVGVVATLLIILFFVYTGDNSLGGVLEFWETTIWLVVGLGLKFLSHLVNFVLDVVTALIGVIPKPFVQMVAHALPRIPIVDVDARFVQPSGLMGEIQNGNLFAVALWISGLLFTDLFESASPALPGSIGALVPSAAPALVALKGLTSLLALMTVFVWIAAIFVVPIGWFSNAMDLGVNLPFESSLGNRPSSHLGIRVRKGEKHNVKASLGQLRNVFRREKPRPESKPDENIN